MASRFQRDLIPVLDTDGMVAGPREAGTALDGPGPATAAPAPPRPPSWTLADVASLKNAGGVDPLFLRASEGLLATREGVRLHTQLVALRRRRVRIVVEPFDDASALFQRRRELTGTAGQLDDGEQVNGFTDPFRVHGDFAFDLDDATQKPAGFNVLILIPRGRPSGATTTSETDWVLDSTPFRFLKLSTTLFHELLHVHHYQQVDFETETIRQTSGGRTFEDFDPDRANTGHQAATFNINVSTLRLETDGEVDATFRQRISTFIDQFVATHGIARLVAMERAAFRRIRSR